MVIFEIHETTYCIDKFGLAMKLTFATMNKSANKSDIFGTMILFSRVLRRPYMGKNWSTLRFIEIIASPFLKIYAGFLLTFSFIK